MRRNSYSKNKNYIVNSSTGKRVFYKGGRKKDIPLEKLDSKRDSHWTQVADKWLKGKD